MVSPPEQPFAMQRALPIPNIIGILDLPSPHLWGSRRNVFRHDEIFPVI